MRLLRTTFAFQYLYLFQITLGNLLEIMISKVFIAYQVINNIRLLNPMNQEQMLKDSFRLYDCQICYKKAHKPIITYCGHLFCWSCYYKSSATQDISVVCGGISQKNDIYPLFIEQQSNEEEEQGLPQRPMPVNRPKIPNADIISNRQIYNKNNIVMGRQFAGTIHFAPLSVLAYSQIDAPEEGDIQKEVSNKLKWIFIILITSLVVLLGVNLLM